MFYLSIREPAGAARLRRGWPAAPFAPPPAPLPVRLLGWHYLSSARLMRPRFPLLTVCFSSCQGSL